MFCCSHVLFVLSLESMLAMGEAQLHPDLTTPITPCFDKVFEPSRKRRCFEPGKARSGSVLPPKRAPPPAIAVIGLMRRWRKKKNKCACNALRCYSELFKGKEFIRRLAHWRTGCVMAVRKEPIALVEPISVLHSIRVRSPW